MLIKDIFASIVAAIVALLIGIVFGEFGLGLITAFVIMLAHAFENGDES